MRTLVHFGCYGDPSHAEMARMLIDSLRGPGRYRGEIAVLTDRTFRGNGRDGAVVHDGEARDAAAIKDSRSAFRSSVQPADAPVLRS